MLQHANVDSQRRWVFGGSLLAVSTMMNVAGAEQLSGIPYWMSWIARSAVIIAALVMLVWDAGTTGAMVSDRRSAWTGTILVSLCIVAPLVSQAVPLPPSLGLFVTLGFVVMVVMIAGLGMLAWAAHSAAQIALAPRRVIVASLMAIAAVRLIEVLHASTTVLMPDLGTTMYLVIVRLNWLVHSAGMLAIALAVILAARRPAYAVAEATTDITNR